MANLAKNDPEKARKYFEDKLSFTTGPKELEDALKEGAVIAVDVRAKKDFDEGHIPGSINLPKDQWSTERGLQKDKLHVVLCYFQQCHLAAQACVELAKRGYSVMELEGGFRAWKDHDGAIEKGESAQPEDAVGRARAFMEEKRAADEAQDIQPAGKRPDAPPKVSAAAKSPTSGAAAGEAKEGEAARTASQEAQQDRTEKRVVQEHAEVDEATKGDAQAKEDADADAHADAEQDADTDVDPDEDADADELARAASAAKPPRTNGPDSRREEPQPKSIH